MISLREYQKPAVDALAKCDLGYIKAPAGSGKTIMVASAMRIRAKAFFAKTGRRMQILWIAYTHELLTQGEIACQTVGVVADIDLRCMQGLAPHVLARFDLVFVDECHRTAAPQSKSVMRGTLEYVDGGFRRRCIVWGCTATPLREDEDPIEPIIGPCVYEVPPSDVAAVGGVLPAIVRPVVYHDPNLAGLVAEEAAKGIRGWMNDEQKSRVVWREVLRSGVTANRGRLEMIALLAESENGEGRSVIILCDTVDMCKAVCAMIESGDALYAAMGRKKREGVLAAFKRGELMTIAATSLADEGLDCPIASVLILARAGKAEGRLTQRVGRVLRPYPGQAAGIVYDVQDTGHGMLKSQFWKRMSCYKKWGFLIEANLNKKRI